MVARDVGRLLTVEVAGRLVMLLNTPGGKGDTRAVSRVCSIDLRRASINTARHREQEHQRWIQAELVARKSSRPSANPAKRSGIAAY